MSTTNKGLPEPIIRPSKQEETEEMEDVKKEKVKYQPHSGEKQKATNYRSEAVRKSAAIRKRGTPLRVTKEKK